MSDWQPWPHAIAPEIHTGLALGKDLVVLVGTSEVGERGRFGILGIPAAAWPLEPGPQTVRDAVDARPHDALRILALGYELGAPHAHLPAQAPPRGQPAGLALDLDAALIVDHRTRRVAVFGNDASAADRLLDALHAEVTRPVPDPIDLVPTVDDAEHARRIRVTKDLIAAGEVYQANITRRLSVTGMKDGLAALDALTQANPVGHGAYVRAAGIELLSNSMETLLTFDPTSRVARSYPIKGTRGRGRDDLSDGRALSRDPKERAEHVMIVDLVRNDLGKVAVPGTVRTATLMHLEAFRGVLHGVSTVEAQIPEDRTQGDVVAALFPGGSITGAPKRRAMQIIRDLEGEPRGFYTGSLGVVTPDGRVSMSILIRTLVRDEEGWSLSVGGGIVADSTPEREIEETWEKVDVFRHVLGSRAVSAA